MTAKSFGRAAVVALAAVVLAVFPGAASADVLLGSSAIQPRSDTNASGSAEAFQVTAATTGSVGALNVYLDAGAAPIKLVAGLYTNNAGHAGTLLAQGSLDNPAAGAWNVITIPSTAVSSGTTYWLAMLGTGGTLRIRDNCCGGGTSAENSAQTNLTTLPASWSAGTHWSDGPASLYGSTAAPAPPSPSVVGQWGSLMSWPLVAIHSVLMQNGKLFLMDGWQYPNDSQVYDPATLAFSTFKNGLSLDLFCSAIVTLGDGRVAVVGGHGSSHLGIDDTMLFNPATNTWSAGAKMSFPRWYPTVTELGDGRLVVISGNIDNGTWADTPEIYNPATNTWSQIFGINTAQVHEEEYPLSFLQPSGKIFTMATSVGQSYLLDPTAPSWAAAGGPTLVNGSAVMYRPGKIVYSGGGTPLNSTAASRATAQTIDLTAGTPTWQATGTMNATRYSHKLVALPDGKVLAVGGDKNMDQSDFDNGELTAEQWDPDTGQWTSMAAMTVPRIYHSTAVLMPDGRVLSAGGGRSNGFGPGQTNAQYYSPPYLFKGPRPTISSAPSSAGYGSTIAVDTPDAASIGSVALVSLGADTHTLDMNQHFVPLTFTRGSATLSVQLPGSASTAPPGYYMLFILNTDGVPSVAPMLKLVAGAADTQPPTAPSSLTANGSLGQASLNWSAATDNVGVTGYDVHRSTSPNFTPSAANRIAQPTGTSYVDSPVAPGTYYYRVIAKDGAGNVSPSSPEAQATVPADTSGPNVSISAPADGATVSGTVSVTATASDNVGVSGVQFKLDGNNLNAEDTSSPYSTSWNSTTVANGNHTLTAVARDAAGNTTTSGSVTVNVSNDTTKPTVSITAPAGGATLSGSAVPVTADAADNVGVSGVQFKLDGNNLNAEDTSSPYSTSWNSTTVANGNHTLTAVARDAAGNTTTSGSVTVTVQNANTGLVAAYSFDEGAGPTVTDRSGNLNDGTIFQATRSVGGHTGDALSFDGVNDWVTVADANSLDLTTGVTLEAWLRPTAGGNWRTALMKEQTNGLSYALYSSTSSGQPAEYLFVGGTDQSLNGTAALALNTWTHVAATYDGANMRLYVNGTQVASVARTGAIATSTGALRLGGNGVWPEWFAGLIDDVRVYNRALTAAQVLADMNAPVGPPAVQDTEPPTAPTNLTASGAIGQVSLNWTAATDNVGVTGYDMHRSTSPNFTPSTANRIAQPTGTSYVDSPLAAGTYYYRVIAKDAAGNAGPSSAEVQAAATSDTSGPSVSLTAPADGTTVSGTVSVTANASDNVGVAGVQFKLDGNNLNAEDTASPYSTSWNTAGASNGSHTLTAVARDAAGNTTTSSSVTVTVSNDTTPPNVSMSAPANGATVSGSAVPVSANASDDVGVSGVQFRLDGANLAAEDTSAPYSIIWNSTAVANGSHTLTAIARDAAGNTTTATAVTVNVQNAGPPSGLVAAYNFEEGAGPTVTDRSGNLNDGTIFQATRSVGGHTGSALSFDGVNDWVTVADANSLDLTSGMTLEAWVYPTAGGGWRTALMKERTNGLTYALYSSTSSGRPSEYLFIGGDRGLDGSAALPLNTWTHVAATYDGANMRIYVNGTQVSSVAQSGAMAASTGALRMGGNGVWPEWFAGLLDDVRVYNKARTAAEVQADMNAPVG